MSEASTSTDPYAMLLLIKGPRLATRNHDRVAKVVDRQRLGVVIEELLVAAEKLVLVEVECAVSGNVKCHSVCTEVPDQ